MLADPRKREAFQGPCAMKCSIQVRTINTAGETNLSEYDDLLLAGLGMVVRRRQQATHVFRPSHWPANQRSMRSRVVIRRQAQSGFAFS